MNEFPYIEKVKNGIEEAYPKKKSSDEIPDLLTNDEIKLLLTKAENLWEDLQKNALGGYSGKNRPFHIQHIFREVIEEFGKRNTGLYLSFDEIKKIKETQNGT
jgi:hypothetical protein